MTIINKKNIFMNLNCADLVQPKNNINLTYLEIATFAIAGIIFSGRFSEIFKDKH